jgi:gliding motility-associated-like protein
VKTNPDITICTTDSLQLNTTGNAQSFVWTPATSLSHTNIANPKASPDVLTEYIVTGTDARGCVAKDTVYVDAYPVPVITKADPTTICKTTSIQIWVNAAGGGTYSWTPSESLDDPSSPNPTASPIVNTMYHVTITDLNDCNYIDSVKVNVHPDPVFRLSAKDEICFKDSVLLRAFGGDTYVWQPANEVTDPNASNPRTGPATTTDYSVTITESTCGVSQTLTHRITVYPLPDVQATSSRNLDCSFDRSQLDVSGAARYLWSPAATLSNATIHNPVASPITPTSYVVKGTDLRGCENTDTILVDITDANKGNYLIPNAFTPNGDGLNDCFGIKFWGIVYEMKLTIYNRWGDLVYSTSDPHACWDGTFKGRMQGPDVFVYVVTAKTNCEPHVSRKGTFTLIR